MHIMALKTFVKISAVNNLTDARYCAGMYVHQLGFNIDPNTDTALSPERFKEITDWLSGVRYVGEFGHADPDQIMETLQLYTGIEVIETNEPLYLPILLNSGYQLILKQHIHDSGQLAELIQKADNFNQEQVTLLLTADGLELDANMIQIIADLAHKCDVLLGFGISASNLTETIQETGVKGIALQGGNEIKPGLIDFDTLADILELLEIED
jgi:phosphoribosylanthranilate isomerase